MSAVAVFGTAYAAYTARAADSAGNAAMQSAVAVQSRTMTKAISSTGKITPNHDLELTFDVAGKVRSVSAVTTQTVQEGEVLAEIVNSRQELAYSTATREYELAKIDSPARVVEEKELAWQLAKDEFEATVLKAPFAGTVADVKVEPGELVTTTTSVIRLIDSSRLYLEVSVDEVDIRHVEVGQQVAVTVDAHPDLSLQGTVVEIGIVPSESGDLVLFPVKVELKETDPRVRPGMSATAKITVDHVEDALAVPLDAVVEVDGSSVVSVVTADGVKPVPVETGISDGILIEIVSGLQKGDRILASNHQLYGRKPQPAEVVGPNMGGGRR